MERDERDLDESKKRNNDKSGRVEPLNLLIPWLSRISSHLGRYGRHVEGFHGRLFSSLAHGSKAKVSVYFGGNSIHP